jgi:catechol 2,3-dioxygenase-like lactoylglutathione lyase family enzyme
MCFFTTIQEKGKERAMEEQKPKNLIFPPSSFCQVGIVVKNIDDTIDYYKEKFGFGPFEIREVDYPNATYYGETAGYRGKRAFFYLGPIQIELIELRDGKTLAGQAGLKVIQSFTRSDGSGFAYLDSDRIGGVLFELIQRPPQKA